MEIFEGNIWYCIISTFVITDGVALNGNTSFVHKLHNGGFWCP